MKILVTGRGGTGKSTINKELVELGYNSLDTDRLPGLAGWQDLETGLPTKVDTSGYVDYSKVGWNWNSNVLKGVLAARKDMILCGSASNQLEFHSLFSRVVVLTVDEATHRNYLKTRDSDYGKGSAMEDRIIDMQQEFLEQALQLGAVAVDNTRPILEVVSEIVRIAGV